jgi:YidC/Oxa1 family membrane protein insertase
MSNVYFDEAPDILSSLPGADVLITDRSGIALEYAFGTFRPVLFINTPPKIMNASWHGLGLQPFENSLRDQIGESISPAHLSSVALLIDKLENASVEYADKLRQLKEMYFFNSVSSYEKGLHYIQSKTRKH